MKVKVTTIKATVPQTAQKYRSVLSELIIPCRFIPKYDVKNESGRNMTVTTVKTRIALLFDSAIIASSFC